MSKYTAAQAVSKFIYFAGYTEKASNAYLDDFYANAGHNNWTRFGRDCGCNPAAWCAMSVSCVTCWDATNAESREMLWGMAPHYNCGTIMDYAKAKGRWHYSKAWGGSYTPQAGDWIVFTYNGGQTRDHVGMVRYVSGGYVYTIEGNSGDKVSYHSYSLGLSTIYGYATPFYAEDPVINTPIAQYQKWLTNIDVDGEYGPQTKKAAIYWHEKFMQFRDQYATGVWNWDVAGWSYNYPCQYGDNNWDSHIVQGQLYCLGYDPTGFDGEFGPGTANAVKKLQEDKGLPVTGIVDGATWAALFGESKPAHTVLGLNDIGGEVYYLQRKLFGLGFVIPCNGIFDSSTEDDVNDFQEQHGISHDGQVGTKTWAALGE